MKYQRVKGTQDYGVEKAFLKKRSWIIIFKRS